jgi:hypothetical protein
MSSATLFFAIVFVAVLVIAFGAGAFYTRRERRAQRLRGAAQGPAEERSLGRRRTESKLHKREKGSP